MYQPFNESKELGLPLFRPHRPWWGALPVRHPKEVENERQDFFEVTLEQQEPPRDLLPGRSISIPIGDPEILSQNLQHRKERDRLPVRQPARLVGRDAARPTAFYKLVAEPAL